MKKVILYIRVSTDEQADTGYSQRSQEETLRRFCELKGYMVMETYFEDHSAKTFIRPQFSKLLLQLRKNKNSIDLVLFTKWDRFSRNAGDAYQMISLLNKLGVEPQAVEQPLDIEVPENKLMLAIYLATPQVENDRRAMNVFVGMRRAKKEGRQMGQAPIGYKNKISEDGKRKWIEPSADAPKVKWIFLQLATGNYTAESIWKQARTMGLGFSKNTFWNALRNQCYCGLIKIPAYKKEPEQIVPAQHKPIITAALFYQVQDVLNGNKKQQRSKVTVDDRFPLRGFLTCPDCNRLLTASSSKGRSQYYDYYHCTSACGVRYKAGYANDKFIAELQKWKPHPAVQQLYKVILKDVHEQLQKIRSKTLLQIKEEMTRLTARKNKALELLMSDSMAADDYRKIKQECEQQLFIQEGKIADTVTSYDIEPLIDKALQVLANVDKQYINSSTEVKRNIIGSMFPDKLEFDGEHYRTTRINEAVRIIYSIGEAFSKIKMGQVGRLSDLSHEVIPLGLEPRAHTLKVYCSTN